MSKNLFSFAKLRKLQRYSLSEEEEIISQLDKEMFFVVTFNIVEYSNLPSRFVYSPHRFHHAFARFYLNVAKMRSLKLHGIIQLSIEWPLNSELTHVIYSFTL